MTDHAQGEWLVSCGGFGHTARMSPIALFHPGTGRCAVAAAPVRGRVMDAALPLQRCLPQCTPDAHS